jgi:quinol-cytochrome oxidoreductase complex cytochrome b subunit
MLHPDYQRPFWGLIFITGLIGGTLAIANLSFAYLYAEWHDPPAPGHLYSFHILLIPIAMAGLMSLYLMLMQRKRGETL